MVLDNLSPLISHNIPGWAEGHSVELASASTPAISNRIEAQSTALRHFPIDGTDFSAHEEQATIRRYMARRNRDAQEK